MYGGQSGRKSHGVRRRRRWWVSSPSFGRIMAVYGYICLLLAQGISANPNIRTQAKLPILRPPLGLLKQELVYGKALQRRVGGNSYGRIRLSKKRERRYGMGTFDIFFSQHGNGSQGCAVGVVGERRLGRQVLVMMTQV